MERSATRSSSPIRLCFAHVSHWAYGVEPPANQNVPLLALERRPGMQAVVKRWRSRYSASGKSYITSWCSRRDIGSVGLVECSSYGLLGGWFDQVVGPWWWRHTPVASTLDAPCSLARSTDEGFLNGYSGVEGDHPPRRSPVSCSRNSR